MKIIFDFSIVFMDYLIEILPYILIGFFISGLIHEFTPTELVNRHLGGKGIKSILCSTIAGTILPICCWGSLPIAVSLHKKGASLGPVLAFLIATPATSITALLVAYGFLGLKFTVYIFFSVILIGVIMGIVGNQINLPDSKNEGVKFDSERGYHSGSETESKEYAIFRVQGKKGLNERFKNVLRYSFIDMVKEIGPELLLGLVLAALITTIAPIGMFINAYFHGGFGYLFSLIFGLVMYICATSSVPLVHAFISQGMNIGAGMLLLLVGPVTSWGTILVLRKEFGFKTLSIYLVTLSVLALSLGYIFSYI